MIHQKNLIVEASQNIESIAIYDIAGKLIHTYILENKSTKFIENFNHAQGVYVAKIKLKNGFLSIKKLIH